MTELKMPLTEHLSDLRKRIVISLVSLLIGFVISFAYSEVLFRFLTIPLRYNISFTLSSPFISFVEKNIKNNPSLVFLAPTEAF
jgi:sec-independent protein translocase protein TatC